jgi:flagellar basal-body rod protein FlgB
MTDKASFMKTFQTLETALQIAQKRHGLIASNISNLDTPEYRAKDIDFKETLERALEGDQGSRLVKTHPDHISLQNNRSVQFEAREDDEEFNGINYVNIDKEMTRLTQNNLIYRTAVEGLLRKMSLLREVIKEGGR